MNKPDKKRPATKVQNSVKKTKKADDVLCLVNLVVKTLDDAKAEDITVLDLKGQTALADYFIIASGTSSRHISALADYLEKAIKQTGHKAFFDGKNASGEWVVVDIGDIIIHLFQPQTRELYEIEKMWSVPEKKEKK